MAAVKLSGGMVLMARMGQGNRRRKRKRDHDDRRSQNAHGQLLQQDNPIVAQAQVTYRQAGANSRSRGDAIPPSAPQRGGKGDIWRTYPGR